MTKTILNKLGMRIMAADRFRTKTFCLLVLLFTYAVDFTPLNDKLSADTVTRRTRFENHEIPKQLLKNNNSLSVPNMMAWTNEFQTNSDSITT